ncbi:unnamed protein product, partial [Amoebophrya sp. A25]
LKSGQDPLSSSTGGRLLRSFGTAKGGAMNLSHLLSSRHKLDHGPLQQPEKKQASSRSTATASAKNGAKAAASSSSSMFLGDKLGVD